MAVRTQVTNGLSLQNRLRPAIMRQPSTAHFQLLPTMPAPGSSLRAPSPSIGSTPVCILLQPRSTKDLLVKTLKASPPNASQHQSLASTHSPLQGSHHQLRGLFRSSWAWHSSSLHRFSSKCLASVSKSAASSAKWPDRTHEGQGALLLTSNGLSTQPLKQAFFEAVPDTTTVSRKDGRIRVAYVPTALLAPSPDSTRSPGDAKRRRRYQANKRARDMEADLGPSFQVTSVDIAEVAGAELEDVLRGSECVYVDGGNTFYLLYYMQQSGFGDIVQDMVCREGALYVGRSAGSIITGQSASTALWKGWDDPTIVPLELENPSESLKGMQILPCSIFPHYDARWEALVKEKSPTLGHDCVMLRDGAGVLARPMMPPSLGSSKAAPSWDYAMLEPPEDYNPAVLNASPD